MEEWDKKDKNNSDIMSFMTTRWNFNNKFSKKGLYNLFMSFVI